MKGLFATVTPHEGSQSRNSREGTETTQSASRSDPLTGSSRDIQRPEEGLALGPDPLFAQKPGKPAPTPTSQKKVLQPTHQQWDPKSTSLGRWLMEFPIQETQSRESSPERSSNNLITLSNDFGEESLRSIPLCSKCLPSSPSLEQLRQPSPSHSSSGLKQWTRYPDLTTRRLNEEFTLSGRVKEGDYKMMGCDMSKIPPFRPLMTVNSFRSQGNEDETMTNLVTLEETIPEMTAVCQEVTSGVSTRTSYPGTRSCWSRRLKES